MNISKLARLPKRLAQDLKIAKLTKNWPKLLNAKARNEPFSRIELRNGVVMESPDEVALNFLFHEIWLDEFYAPPGYSIGPGQTVLDVGANIGVFALYAATRAPGVRVKSYEPFPKNADYLNRNLSNSKIDGIEFFQLAIADRAGTRKLHVDASWILHSLTDKDSAEDGLTVDCISLDEALQDCQVCHLIKLDCEGGEYEALYSASENSLSKIKRVVCEFNVVDSDRRNGDGLSEFLTSNGFTVTELRSLDVSTGFICATKYET